MLAPQSNAFRQAVRLPDFWDFRFDEQAAGQTAGWSSGFSGGRPIAVPASWNDQFADGRDNLGPAWYQVRFARLVGAARQHTWLLFGSVNYLAEVWLNGQRLGAHEGGHLPFEFDLGDRLHAEDNLLVLCVDGSLAPDRVPPGNVPFGPPDAFDPKPYPPGSFDFFPYCGIHRPVTLYTTPSVAIRDLTVQTDIEDNTGFVSVHVEISGGDDLRVFITLNGHGINLTAEVAAHDGAAETQLRIPNPALWAPGSPNLYDLTVEIRQDGQTVDRYKLPIGIRTVRVDGDQLLLNGRPVKLLGFGRHEDFPVSGRGYQPALIVKDYALMDWVGANSFRTSHYPYSEEMLDLADRLGFLVIDETPAVGLFFAEEGLERRSQLCKQFTREMIRRDKNHPSVILWSLANEPHSHRPAARPFFEELAGLARALDATRPVTLVSYIGQAEESFEFMDVVCINRYLGWYSQFGRIEEAVQALEADLQAIHTRFNKPILMTEFGADALPGQHAQPPEMFSEEYQSEFIRQYIETMDQYPFVIGQHVWNLCDFKTGQAVHRMNAMNYKGVFTRDRRPKLAAHTLRKLWKKRF